ncbi:unnamed protein product [Rhizophagus irregularis]|nr:unnamed protein product [Rhizophagus irregularis]
MAAEDTVEILTEKLKIYQKLMESFAPSIPVPLNILTSQGSSTPSTQGSSTPASIPFPTAVAKIIYKLTKRYIKVEEILALTDLKKNEYNNLLSEVRFVMASLHTDFNIPYKSQNINLISKIIKKFTKRNPNAPFGEGNWVVKELIKKHLQHRRDYVKRKNNIQHKKGKEKEREREKEKEKERENEKEKEKEKENRNEIERENENIKYHHQQVQDNVLNNNIIDVDQQISNVPFHLVLPGKKSTTASRFRRQYFVYEENEHEMDNEKIVKPKEKIVKPKEKIVKPEEKIVKPKEKRKRKLINYKE